MSVIIRAGVRRLVFVIYVQFLTIVFAPTVGAQIVEGKVYREKSTPEVYLISAGKRIWVPTPDALFGMGFNWPDVVVVPDGTLNAYPRFNIRSSSLTPGSLIFPPEGKAHPLAVSGAVKAMWQGKEVQLIELYGWLRAVADACNYGEPDFHYNLELDTDWALTNGIDLHKILRVGNIAWCGLMLPGFHPRHAVSLPMIHIEVNAWEWNNVTAGRSKPPDWIFVGNCATPATWPFDQFQPTPGSRLEPMANDIARRGPYVRVAGSLMTDHPHDVPTRPSTEFSHEFAISINDDAEWEGSAPDWNPGMDSNSPDRYARWTEVHPADSIEVLAPKEPRVTVRAVALAARVGKLPFGLSNSCEEAEFDIFPEAARPPSSQIGYEELRGPETYFPWGENENNGSWITTFDDHVHVKARVCGGGIGGSPGRFKAIYRAWWQTVPSGPTTRTGSIFTSTDSNKINYVIEPNVVASDTVEFRLCLGAGLTWEKRMNMPDGQGSSWNLIVKDSTRCATNGLWAGQVSNGQSLTFYKEKGFLRGITKVHEVPMNNFAPLPGGTRVTFTWTND